MNQVIIMGNLVRDPDIRATNTTTIARYTLAVGRRGKEEGADYISCVSFGKGAEFASKWLKKGMRILVSGHIQTGSYTNKDGQKVYTTDVIVETQEFCEKKSEEKPGEGFMSLPEGFENAGLPFN